MRRERQQRASFAFGLGGRDWNEELALQRYELLYEAALVEEATRGLGKLDPCRYPGRR